HLHRLIVIEARVEGASVIAAQVSLGDTAGATDTFGDIFAGHFEVHAAQMRAAALQHAVGLFEFVEDFFKMARLNALAGGLGISMHRIATPDYFVPGSNHRLGQWRQTFRYVAHPETSDEGQAARLILGIECLCERKSMVGRGVWTELYANRVGNA